MSEKQIKEELDDLRAEVKTLTTKMLEIEQTQRIKRILKDQEKGTFKYLLDTLKVIAAIVFLATAGNKAADLDWVQKLIE